MYMNSLKSPESDLLSVEQVAERLGLHVRTVRSYVRQGRLKAVRIGKQYRVSQGALDTLTGQAAPVPVTQANVGSRHVEVSAIVQAEGVDRRLADRLTTTLLASAQGPPEPGNPLRIDTLYDQERGRLKVFLTGSVATTATLLKFIDALLESELPGAEP
jgi:excisionase family DNA binding protein